MSEATVRPCLPKTSTPKRSLIGQGTLTIRGKAFAYARACKDNCLLNKHTF